MEDPRCRSNSSREEESKVRFRFKAKVKGCQEVAKVDREVEIETASTG